jgi:hypothetical protein
MSKSNTFENDHLRLVFHGVSIAGIADNPTVNANTALYLALHAADPGEAGTQTANEANYTGYSRQSVARSTLGFTINGSTVTLASDVLFPTRTDTGAAQLITHFSVGTTLTGPGKVLYSGPISPTISVTQNTRPRMLTSTSITED